MVPVLDTGFLVVTGGRGGCRVLLLPKRDSSDLVAVLVLEDGNGNGNGTGVEGVWSW